MRRWFHGDVLEVAHGSREVAQRLHVVLFRGPAGPQIDRNVLGGGLEPVEGITQVFPVSATDHDFVGSKVATPRFATGLVRSLSMRCAAVALGTAGSTGRFERSPAPRAVSHLFRHSDGTLPRHTALAGDQISRRCIR